MLTYPEINPIALELGPVAIHWYGVLYLVGFALAWGLGIWRARRPSSGWSREQVGDLVYTAALGVVIGGRLGYMLFYDFSGWWQHPLSVFYLWQGGMSFHGGLLGVCAAMAYIARRQRKHFFDVADFMAPLVPLGLAAGRLGNFINGELWGRISDVPWAMVFPQAGSEPRHPSQLYEFTLEGLVLFAILWGYSQRPRPRYATSGLFLLGYGGFRFLIEFFRMPDWQLGYILFNWMTMGQLLSLPMVLIGAGLVYYAGKWRDGPNAHVKA